MLRVTYQASKTWSSKCVMSRKNRKSYERLLPVIERTIALTLKSIFATSYRANNSTQLEEHFRNKIHHRQKTKPLARGVFIFSYSFHQDIFEVLKQQRFHLSFPFFVFPIFERLVFCFQTNHY